MQKMIDWWTVRGETFGIRNVDFKVELEPDQDVTLGSFTACSDEDILAYEGGGWRFVRVNVTPVDRSLNDFPHCRAYVDHVQWGLLGERDDERPRIDREHITSDQVADAVYAVVDELKRIGFVVDFADDSPYRHEF